MAYKTKLLVTAAIVAMLDGTVAYGQTAAPNAAPVTADSPLTADGDIIVTAQRRSERLLDVPISVTAITGQALNSSAITSTLAIQNKVPGLNITTVNGFAQPNLRGVSNTNTQAAVPPSVATYVDGIYNPSGSATLINLLGIERIEVLKGPQGTLYGRNTLGGAISYYTLTPKPEVEAKLSAGYGNFDRYQANGYLSGGLADNLTLGVYGGFTQSDPYFKTTILSPPARQIEPKHDIEYAVRVKSVYTPSDWLKLTASATVDRVINASTHFRENNPNNVPFILSGTPAVTTPYRATQDTGTFYRITNQTYSFRADATANWADFVSLTGFERGKYNGNSDLDGTPAALLSLVNNSRTKTLSQEFQILSPTSSKIKWIGGLYFAHQQSGYSEETTHVGPLFLAAPCILQGLPASDCPTVPANLAGGAAAIVDFKTYAVFGQATAPLDFISSRLNLTLGGRYTMDRSHLNGHTYLATYDPASGLDLSQMFLADAPKLPQKENVFTPKATLDYKLGQTLFYVTWSKGYQEGVYNLAGSPPLAGVGPVKPQRIEAFEGGIKTQFWDHRGTLEFAAYHYSFTDIQVQISAGGLPTITNAAAAKIKGFELNASLRPVNSLSLSGGVSYIDGEYTKFPGFIDVIRGPGGFNLQITADESGNRIAKTPKWSGYVGADYRQEIRNDTYLHAGANLRYTGNFFWTPGNHSYQKQQAYALLDATAGVTFGHWDITAWATNLTNKFYETDNNPTQFGDLVRDADPRRYGVTLAWKL